MLGNTAGAPPIISIISSDGARFVVPERAAEYSVLLRSALERWTLEYLSQPSTAINNDDDDDDDDECDSSEEATDPLRSSSTSEHLGTDSSSSCTSSTSMDDDNFANRCLLPGRQPTAPLGDISPKDEARPHMSLDADFVASDDGGGTFEKVDGDGGTADPGHDDDSGPVHEPFTPPHSASSGGDGLSSGSLEASAREVREPTGDSRALCEDLLPHSNTLSLVVCSNTQTRHKREKNGLEGGCDANYTGEAGLERDHSPTVVVLEEGRADTGDGEAWFGVGPMGMPSSSLTGTPNEKLEAVEGSPKNMQKVDCNYHNLSPAFNSTNLCNSFDNKSSPQSEWRSPASVHQRTPVMLEDDDKVIIMGNDGQQETLHSFDRLSTSPCAATVENPCHGDCDNACSTAVKSTHGDTSSPNSNHNNSARENNKQPFGTSVGIDGKSVVLLDASETVVFPPDAKNHVDMHDDAAADLGDIFNQVRITAGEILIDLRTFPFNGESSVSPPFGSSPHSTTASSHRRSSSQAMLRPAERAMYKEDNGGGAAPHYNGNGGTTDPQKIASHSPKVPSKALQLCVDYILHFVQVDQYSEVCACEGTPTALSMPLTAPLYGLLLPWERNFLYARILGYDASALKGTILLNTIVPGGIHYDFPGMALADRHVRDALVMSPPRAEGMRTLVQVRKAAQELRIDSLHELCLAWMADFMIRASYGTSNNFQAANIIQECFGIKNEWTQKEMNCLRIENDWPTNEEEC